MDKKERTRLRVQRYRDNRKALHSDSVTPSSVTHDRRTVHLAEALIDPVKRSRLIMISNALDKETIGLDYKTGEFKSINMGTRVRYGIGGFLYSEIKELLD